MFLDFKIWKQILALKIQKILFNFPAGFHENFWKKNKKQICR